MPFETKAGGAADPGSGDDGIGQKGRLLVINLVAKHDPKELLLIGRRSGSTPVGNGRILNPANIGDVVHMAELVDIAGKHGNHELEDFRGGRFGRGGHGFIMRGGSGGLRERDAVEHVSLKRVPGWQLWMVEIIRRISRHAEFFHDADGAEISWNGE